MKNTDRRAWLKSAGIATAAGYFGSWRLDERTLASPIAPPQSDSSAMQLYKSLSDEQKAAICLPSNHPARKYVSNWWYIHPKHRVPNIFNRDQQELVRKIFDAMHSEHYVEAVNKQVLADQYGEKGNAPAVGFFGNPNEPDFEFLFTGHHVTRRCNAHTDKGMGFGGNPIFYGHYPHEESSMNDNFNESSSHPGNPYWYQGQLFNEFVKSLDGKQQQSGLVRSEPRDENSSEVNRMYSVDRGLKCETLSSDQKTLLLDTMRKMLAMFRDDDVKATMETIEKKNVIDRLNISWFGGKYDIGSDRIWDTWQIEGPELVWYFRGYPHIHCYFHCNS